MEFRNLRTYEISVRPTDTKTKGVATLLLYKDARVDMDILDETVGPEKWQKEYYEVKGNVYCKVGIKCGDEWIWKSDAGVEGNIDAAKSEASDAFKRACVNWGIGRELYTGPRIKVKCPDSYYIGDKLTMAFYVKSISYEGKMITELYIEDRFGNVVFNWSCNDGVRPVEGFSEKPSTAMAEQTLVTFCQEIKPSLSETEQGELVKFYRFYKDKAKAWKGKFNATELWQRWLSKAA